MMRSLLLAPGRAPLRLLCLGAHADDIEIGAGGTILRLLAEQKAEVHWVVFSATPERAREARRAASLFLEGATRSKVVVKRFRDGFFPAQFSAIKKEFEEFKKLPEPNVILCPWRGDAHQDHRTVAELVWNTFRDHLVLEYEIPKYDGDLGNPGFFVPLEEDICRKKVAFLRQAFRSQRARRWFHEETFLAMLRLRGIESNAPSGLAEAFHCRKLVL
jgi:LmbE family N-acetylglucosaminyl deacetylase